MELRAVGSSHQAQDGISEYALVGKYHKPIWYSKHRSNTLKFVYSSRFLGRALLGMFASVILFVYLTEGDVSRLSNLIGLGSSKMSLDEGYTPSALGKRLLATHSRYMAQLETLYGAEIEEETLSPSASSAQNGHSKKRLLDESDELQRSMFDLLYGLDESYCNGWSPEVPVVNWTHLLDEKSLSSTEDINNRFPEELEAHRIGKRRRRRSAMANVEEKREDEKNADTSQECWRAKMWKQIDGWDWEHDGFRVNLRFKERNAENLNRLKRCLLFPSSELSSYPSNMEDLRNTNWTEKGVIEGRECSLTSLKVVLGFWNYFTMAYADVTNPGETVWIRNQIESLYEQGYTVLAVNSYQGMIDIHRAMPDIISQIWTEDLVTLTCQDDPRCVLFSSFTPTTTRYDIFVDSLGEPTMWGQLPPDENGRQKSKWVWTKEELSRLRERERGTIPGWKLFTTTYWGARPGDPYWLFQEEEFAWNALGQQWTLTPFDYPHHTYIPYSLEKQCLQATLYSEKENQVFILAKRTEYLHRFNSVPPTFWRNLKSLTGLSALSVAIDDEGQEDPNLIGLPEGIQGVGTVTVEMFDELVGQSKVMVGIGRPLISPSVYSALCQGTPVVVPYFKDEPVPKGWDLFSGSYVQHGPAAAIGPPYVYSYQQDNTTMLVEKINEAASHPIGRFIPPDMTHDQQSRNMDDLMRFNWELHAQLIEETNNVERSDLRRIVIGRCFEIGRCDPL